MIIGKYFMSILNPLVSIAALGAGVAFPGLLWLKPAIMSIPAAVEIAEKTFGSKKGKEKKEYVLNGVLEYNPEGITTLPVKEYISMTIDEAVEGAKIAENIEYEWIKTVGPGRA